MDTYLFYIYLPSVLGALAGCVHYGRNYRVNYTRSLEYYVRTIASSLLPVYNTVLMLAYLVDLVTERLERP